MLFRSVRRLRQALAATRPIAGIVGESAAIRGISERTGISRSTVADRVVMLGETARPEHVVGRDGQQVVDRLAEPRVHVAQLLRRRRGGIDAAHVRCEMVTLPARAAP